MGVPETWTRRAEMPMPPVFDPSNGVGLIWTGCSGAEAAAGVGAVSASALPPLFVRLQAIPHHDGGRSGMHFERETARRRAAPGEKPYKTVFAPFMDRFR